jgi:hypothetical protein
MIEGCEQLGFVFEARDAIGISDERCWQNFQRDVAPEPGVSGAVHFARFRQGREERTSMPSDETRRLLKMLGVAVTEYEDAVRSRSSSEEIRKREAEARGRLAEVSALTG